MNQADFKQYAEQELQKCQRYKSIWKRATNPRIKDKAFFAWCLNSPLLNMVNSSHDRNIIMIFSSRH